MRQKEKKWKASKTYYNTTYGNLHVRNIEQKLYQLQTFKVTNIQWTFSGIRRLSWFLLFQMLRRQTHTPPPPPPPSRPHSEHPIIAIWNNSIQNGRCITEKVHYTYFLKIINVQVSNRTSILNDKSKIYFRVHFARQTYPSIMLVFNLLLSINPTLFTVLF